MQKNMISAKEIMRKFSIPYHTINYYTMIGLLTVLLKSRNQRLYDEDEVRQRLGKITELSNEGYTLSLIRKKILGV